MALRKHWSLNTGLANRERALRGRRAYVNCTLLLPWQYNFCPKSAAAVVLSSLATCDLAVVNIHITAELQRLDEGDAAIRISQMIVRTTASQLSLARHQHGSRYQAEANW